MRSTKKFVADPLKTKALKRAEKGLTTRSARTDKVIAKIGQEKDLGSAIKRGKSASDSYGRSLDLYSKRLKQVRRRKIGAAAAGGGALGGATAGVATVVDKKGK